MCGFYKVWVCLIVGFEKCGYVYVWDFNVWVCVCVIVCVLMGFVMCGCVNVWFL